MVNTGAHSCYSSSWNDTLAKDTQRQCASDKPECFIDIDGCCTANQNVSDEQSNICSYDEGGSYQGCTSPNDKNVKWHLPIMVYLNDPSDRKFIPFYDFLSSNLILSAKDPSRSRLPEIKLGPVPIPGPINTGDPAPFSTNPAKLPSLKNHLSHRNCSYSKEWLDSYINVLPSLRLEPRGHSSVSIG